MTPQELKNSILQLAIQGRLVEQNKGEKSPDLSDIKSITTDELDFDLPVSWKTAHLESITISIPAKKYQILESEVQKTGIYPVISQSKEYSIGYSDDENKVFHHVKPVIVFGDHTTVIKYVEFDFIVGADGIKIFEPLYHLLSPKYLFYVMEYYAIGLEKVGGYSRHYKYIKNKPIPIPPLAEQKRIVAKIEELLPLIDRYEKAWSRLEEFNKRFPDDMQKSILQMAIQGKLVEQRSGEGTGEELYQQIQAEKQKLIKEGNIKKEKPIDEIAEDEKSFDIPDTWRWVRFSDLYSLSNGLASRGSSNGTPRTVLRLADLSNGFVDLSHSRTILLTDKEFDSHQVTNGDLLFIRVNGSKSKVATAFQYSNEQIVSYCDHLFCGHRVCEMVYAEYIMYVFNSKTTRLQLTPEIKTTAGQHTISQTSMAKILIPLPPLAEQKRIVARLKELLPLCDHLNKSTRQ